MTEENHRDSESRDLIREEPPQKKKVVHRSAALARMRQRAYRERMKDRGLRELRLLLLPENHDSIRRLVQLFSNGDKLTQVCAAPDYCQRPSWIPRWWPWYSLQKRAALIILAIILGGGLLTGAWIQREIDLEGAHITAKLLPELRRTVARLETEKAHLLAQLKGARAEATRAATHQTDIRATLQSISLDVGRLDASLNNTIQQKSKYPTPPGPRLVPLNSQKQGDNKAISLMKLGLYRFQKGDSLDSVAKRFGIKITDIQKINQKLRPEPWRIGDHIVIPLMNQDKISLNNVVTR